MDTIPGASVIERGIFDPSHTTEAAVFAAWTCTVVIIYWKLATKHQSGPTEWALLMLGVLMPSYALRYVFFGTRWGSNSSFAMVNLLFTSLCPARILLPCPDSNSVNCQLNYPKLHLRATDLAPFSAAPDKPKLSNDSSQHISSAMRTAYSAQNATTERLGVDAALWAPTVQCCMPHRSNASQGSDTLIRPDAAGVAESTEQQGRRDQKGLQFPVLVPLWQMYVRERPLPIYLHTTCMTVAALVWPLQRLDQGASNWSSAGYTQMQVPPETKVVLLQLWKSFRQYHHTLHRRLGYLALVATTLGSLSAAPYALSYLFSARLPETITGLGYLGMYSSAGCFLVKGIQHARNKCMPQHQLNMVRLVGLSWGVSPIGRILTVTPPIIWLSGPWNNAAVVCLSWPLGIWVAQNCLLGGAATVHQHGT